MGSKLTKVAICYDFDGTLSAGNMQEYDFLPGLGITPNDFWAEAGRVSRQHTADPILAYMKLMLDKARESGTVAITRRSFQEFGRTVKLFDGVETWFARLNDFARSQELELEHYIISSGLKEMLEGTAIYNEFKQVFACSFIYDDAGVAQWPAMVVNYTTKTQFLFRINRAAFDLSSSAAVNAFIPKDQRPIPFSRFIYIGDGDSDVPCMKLVKDKGGYSIAVHAPGRNEKLFAAQQLLEDGRVNFVAEANYAPGLRLEHLVQTVLKKINAELELDRCSGARGKNPELPF